MAEATRIAGAPAKPTVLDFLGREAPVSFEGQAALPVGGPGIGVSSGPTTIAGSGVAPAAPSLAPAADPEMEALMRQAEQFMRESAGGGPAGSDPSSNAATSPGPGVSGMDANAAALALDTMATALGVPGLVGLASGLATGIPAATSVPGVAPAVPSAGKGLIGLLSQLGLLPQNQVTMQTEEGPVQGVAVNTPTGFLGLLGALASSLGLTEGPVPGIAANIANPNNDPEAMGLISFTQPSPVNAGWIDTTALTSLGEAGAPNAQGGFVDDPEGSTGPTGPGPAAPSTGPSSPGTGAGGVGTGGPGTGSAGTGGSGGAGAAGGTSGAGGEGTSGEGTGVGEAE